MSENSKGIQKSKSRFIRTLQKPSSFLYIALFIIIAFMAVSNIQLRNSLDYADSRIDDLSSKIDSLAYSVDRLSGSVSDIENEVGILRSSISDIESDVDELRWR